MQWLEIPKCSLTSLWIELAYFKIDRRIPLADEGKWNLYASECFNFFGYRHYWRWYHFPIVRTYRHCHCITHFKAVFVDVNLGRLPWFTWWKWCECRVILSSFQQKKISKIQPENGVDMKEKKHIHNYVRQETKAAWMRLNLHVHKFKLWTSASWNSNDRTWIALLTRARTDTFLSVINTKHLFMRVFRWLRFPFTFFPIKLNFVIWGWSFRWLPNYFRCNGERIKQHFLDAKPKNKVVINIAAGLDIGQISSDIFPEQ